MMLARVGVVAGTVLAFHLPGWLWWTLGALVCGLSVLFVVGACVLSARCSRAEERSDGTPAVPTGDRDRR